MTSRKILEGSKLQSTFSFKTLGELFFDTAEKNAEKICQINGTTDETETYASVRTRSTRVAMDLLQRGITSDDVIAFCSCNTINTVIPILATFYVGAKVANLEPSLSVRQTQHLISLILPKIIFVEAESVDLIEESLKAANFQTEIIVYGDSAKYATLSKLTEPKNGEENFRPVKVDVHEIAIMFFSSGTTGLPKAICHSHYSFINIGNTLLDMGLGNVVFHFTTFYWVTAVMMTIYSIMVGGSRAFGRSFEPEVVFRTIEKYKVNTVFMAPVLAYKLLKYENAKKYDTSSVKQVHCGGTPISPSHFLEIKKLFKHSSVLNVYGMSEVGYISSFVPERDEEFIKTRLKSCGKPVSGLRLKVVDDSTNEILGPNQKGEIRVQTTCIMTGYYKTDSSSVFDEDGFLKTGDVGYYDEDGCLYVVERIKEMFKYQSYHIVPSAIEGVLLEHPAVKESAVFGVPCGEDGEAPGACIVLKSGVKVNEKEIFDFVAERVSDREKLRGGITFVSSLPKTPTGKLVRKEVRNLIVKNTQN